MNHHRYGAAKVRNREEIGLNGGLAGEPACLPTDCASGGILVLMFGMTVTYSLKRPKSGSPETALQSCGQILRQSRYPSTSSRETVGHPVKNSSIEKPLFRSSNRRRTGKRA